MCVYFCAFQRYNTDHCCPFNMCVSKLMHQSLMRQCYFATFKRGVVIDLKEPICELPLIPFSDSIFWIHHGALYIAHGTSSLHNRFVYRTLNVAPTYPHAIEADENSWRYVSTRIKRNFLILASTGKTDWTYCCIILSIELILGGHAIAWSSVVEMMSGDHISIKQAWYRCASFIFLFYYINNIAINAVVVGPEF